MEDKLMWSNEGIEEFSTQYFESKVAELGSLLRNYVSGAIGENQYLLIDAKRVDWQGNRGYKKVATWTYDIDLGREVLPDYECNFEVYKAEDGSLYASVSSHDVPTGGTWEFKAMKDLDEVIDEAKDTTFSTMSEFIGFIKEEIDVDLNELTISEAGDYWHDRSDEEWDKCYSFNSFEDGCLDMIIVWVAEDGSVADICFYDEEALEELYIKTL